MMDRQTRALHDVAESIEILAAVVDSDLPLGSDFESAVCEAHRRLGRIVRDLCRQGALS